MSYPGIMIKGESKSYHKAIELTSSPIRNQLKPIFCFYCSCFMERLMIGFRCLENKLLVPTN